MPTHLEPDVRELYHVCHPDGAALPPSHFFAMPTLIVVAPYPDHVIAYSSYTLNITDAGHTQIWLKDTGVAPEHRGQGIARALMLERLRIGREMGADVAIGVTQPDNEPMLRLLRGLRFDELKTDPAAGLIFGLDLR